MREKSTRSTFNEVHARLKKPGTVSPGHWEKGLAVTQTLMEIGEPEYTLKDSNIGPDVPYVYKIGRSDVTVEHKPDWGYATVDDGAQRTHVRLDVLNNDVPAETVVANLKKTIQNVKEKSRKSA